MSTFFSQKFKKKKKKNLKEGQSTREEKQNFSASIRFKKGKENSR